VSAVRGCSRREPIHAIYEFGRCLGCKSYRIPLLYCRFSISTRVRLRAVSTANLKSLVKVFTRDERSSVSLFALVVDSAAVALFATLDALEHTHLALPNSGKNTGICIDHSRIPDNLQWSREYQRYCSSCGGYCCLSISFRLCKPELPQSAQVLSHNETCSRWRTNCSIGSIIPPTFNCFKTRRASTTNRRSFKSCAPVHTLPFTIHRTM
jgi:hypothetical protein